MAQGNHCFEPERHVIALFGLSYSRFVLAEAREGSSTAVRWEIRDWGKENRETGKQEEKQGRCGLSERYRKMTRKKMRKGKGKCNRKTENREVEMRQETERENGKEKRENK